MTDFNSLPQAIGEGEGYTPIEEKDLAFEGDKLTDETALKLVIQDTTIAEHFLQSKALATEWSGADDLYRDYVPRQKWPNSDKFKSAIPMPVVMEAVESLLPQAHMAFFSDVQPFALDPIGQTTADAAKAMAHLAMWGMEECGFVEEIRKMLKSGLLYGTLVGKLGWATSTHAQNNYSLSGATVKNTKKFRQISHPVLEYVSLRNLLVSPHTNCQDIRTSRFVVHQKFIDANELDALRSDDGYQNVPTREQLKTILAAKTEPTKDTLEGSKDPQWRENQAERPTAEGSADPLKQPLELLEYWTDDRVITVLQRTIVIRNEENPLGYLPFLSCSFIDVLDSFYGFGVAKELAGEQWLQQGLVNKMVDNLSITQAGAWHRKKGGQAASQNIQIGPGKVINDDGELEPLKIESMMAEALQAIEASSARASRRVGANFGPEMPNQAMRTAEGVNAFTSGVQTKLQYFIETFANLVFIPAIKSFIQLTKDNLDPVEMRAILSDRDFKAVQSIPILDIYNGKYSVNVLSSVKLSGRRGMSAMITPLTQLIGQPAFQDSLSQQSRKFNMGTFMDQVFQITGWPGDDCIEDMTDEDKQQRAANNPALIKSESDQQKQTQQHQNDLELADRKGDVQGGVAVVRSALKGGEDIHKSGLNVGEAAHGSILKKGEASHAAALVLQAPPPTAK